MSKKILILFLTISFSFALAQTKNENLNAQLGEMKKFFLAGDYENFANYTYPKVIEMMGGKSNMVKVTKQGMDKMKDDGFSFTDLNFKNPTEFLKKGKELQCSITQVIVMKTPRGKIESEYTLIGISNDNGQKWTFIDTSGKEKETMLKYFPNLHEDIIIKPKKQKLIE
ncbi:hypothetical protein GCM10010992_07670 [Cloacibacterium rupense]|uniref:DUF4440 domain-containing protein n=1 Tax=Cloacibacterium rupense TaxID=517423 RepID=A0ABQ2NGA7_9FLAO|nr:hypothetical protein [Cloacibacterium rupense]GGP02587.1 hypothetical protein GCM10010992_07670 [Cloacibacterium rupense]